MFTKYDVYTTVQSMYCYPDTDVLINKLNMQQPIKTNECAHSIVVLVLHKE